MDKPNFVRLWVILLVFSSNGYFTEIVALEERLLANGPEYWNCVYDGNNLESYHNCIRIAREAMSNATANEGVPVPRQDLEHSKSEGSISKEDDYGEIPGIVVDAFEPYQRKPELEGKVELEKITDSDEAGKVLKATPRPKPSPPQHGEIGEGEEFEDSEPRIIGHELPFKKSNRIKIVEIIPTTPPSIIADNALANSNFLEIEAVIPAERGTQSKAYHVTKDNEISTGFLKSPAEFEPSPPISPPVPPPPPPEEKSPLVALLRNVNPLPLPIGIGRTKTTRNPLLHDSVEQGVDETPAPHHPKVNLTIHINFNFPASTAAPITTTTPTTTTTSTAKPKKLFKEILKALKILLAHIKTILPFFCPNIDVPQIFHEFVTVIKLHWKVPRELIKGIIAEGKKVKEAVVACWKSYHPDKTTKPPTTKATTTTTLPTTTTTTTTTKPPVIISTTNAPPPDEISTSATEPPDATTSEQPDEILTTAFLPDETTAQRLDESGMTTVEPFDELISTTAPQFDQSWTTATVPTEPPTTPEPTTKARKPIVDFFEGNEQDERKRGISELETIMVRFDNEIMDPLIAIMEEESRGVGME